jgi:hypothetical protein
MDKLVDRLRIPGVYRLGRQSRGRPGLEPADDVGGVDQAHLLQVGRGQAGLKALGADQDDPFVVAGD